MKDKPPHGNDIFEHYKKGRWKIEQAGNVEVQT
jgi:hypothetical protein